MLDDAAPLFGPPTLVPGAGVLLGLPALLESGVLETAREIYGTLAPAFHGLRTTVMTLLLMALLRVKRPEALEERSPLQLGRVLGLDRGARSRDAATEVDATQRLLTRPRHRIGSRAGRSTAHPVAAKRWRSSTSTATCALITESTRSRKRTWRGCGSVCLQRRTTGVNDAQGEPLFVVTAEANADLVEMLPQVLEEVRSLIGDRRATS